MGLLSKLVKQVVDSAAESLAKQEAEKAAEGVLQKLEDTAHKIGDLEVGSAADLKAKVSEQAPPSETTVPGNSWGPTMPLEENQFNYAGGFASYFEMIFREDFGAYRLEKESLNGGKDYVFTLMEGEKKALVVEVLHSNTARRKLQRICQRAGIPYTRFYHDHEGWWNTRTYVVERCKKAMEGRL